MPGKTFNIETLAKLDNPWALAFLPDSTLLVTEKPGRLRIFADGELSEPIGGVPKVAYHEQGGLLDVEVDPGFAQNGLLYLSYTEAAEEQPKGAKDEGDPRLGQYQDLKDVTLKGLAVARGRFDGIRLHDVTVIWRQLPKTIGRGHFGGRILFGPDGKLFILSGERQRFQPAQDLSTNLGKVVRINADGTIPEDNPFVGRQGALPDIWSLCHRNPLGAAFHPETGALWINEMGPQGGDEINIIEKGKNYGWPEVSNGDHYNDEPITRHAERPEFVPPIFSWNPSISPAGFVFYTGAEFPAWRGSALIGGLGSEALIVVLLKGDSVRGEERIAMTRVRDLIQAPDGAILLLTDGDKGKLLRLTRAEERKQ